MLNNFNEDTVRPYVDNTQMCRRPTALHWRIANSERSISMSDWLGSARHNSNGKRVMSTRMFNTPPALT